MEDSLRPGRSDQDEPSSQLPGLPRLFFPDNSRFSPDQPRPPVPPDTSYGQVQTRTPIQIQQAPPRESPPPARRPPTRRRTSRPDRELRQRAIAALVFGLISLFSLGWLGGNLRRGVYLLAFSAIIGLMACVIGITAIVKARRTEVYRPRGTLGGIISGAIAVIISLPIITVYLAYPAQTQDFVQCLRTAQTFSAEHACDSQFYRSIGLGALSNADGAAHLPERTATVAPSGRQGPGRSG